MSYLGRSTGMFALAVLTLSFGLSTAALAGQVSAIKDGWLVTKVHSEFVNEDVLSGSNIDVDVKDGVVTLQGTVPSEAARARALAVAKANSGVKSVVDQLRIAPAAQGGKMDRAGDKVAETADKAGDKTASTAKKTGRAIDDGWIKSKIYAQYMADWNTVLDDSDIDIDVDNNAVTLNGTVKSAQAKAKAVSIAKATDGVKSVKDNLKVVAGTR
jgi:hyperosmotically inducible protein